MAILPTGDELARKFDERWDPLTKLAGANPKTTIVICLAIGLVLGGLLF